MNDHGMGDHGRPRRSRTVLLLAGGASLYVCEDAEAVCHLLESQYAPVWLYLTDSAGRNLMVRAASVQALHPARVEPAPRLPAESVHHVHERFRSAA